MSRGNLHPHPTSMIRTQAPPRGPIPSPAATGWWCRFSTSPVPADVSGRAGPVCNPSGHFYAGRGPGSVDHVTAAGRPSPLDSTPVTDTSTIGRTAERLRPRPSQVGQPVASAAR